jgi:hypothetical protein
MYRSGSKSRLFFPLLFIFLAFTFLSYEFWISEESAAAPRQARQADSLIESMGVALHMHYTDDATYKLTHPKLGALGIRYVRDGGQGDGYFHKVREIHRMYGIRWTMAMDPRDGYTGSNVPSRGILPILNALEAVEGPNEWDVNTGLQYNGSNFPNGVRNFQNEMYNAIKNFTHSDKNIQSRVRAIKVLTPSMANPNNSGRLGVVSADIGNMHSYTGAMLPDQELDSKWIPETRKMISPSNKPIVATETGWCNDVDNPNGCTNQGGVSERATAKYIPRMYFEYFNRGLMRCFVYNLSTDYWSSFLRSNGSERPAYYAVQSMIKILEDPGPDFTPGSLDYTISGDRDTLRETLLQKRDGRFYLILYLNKLSYQKKTGSSNGRDLESSRSLTVSFGKPIKRVNLYTPSFNRTSVISTHSDVSTLNVTVSDHPLILELSSDGNKPPPASGKPTPTPEPTANPQPTPAPPSGTGQPDLVITKILTDPASPVGGDNVIFKAVVKNQGSGPSPDGVIHGVKFEIGGYASWSDSYAKSIPSGGTVTLTANGGTTGSNKWKAASGKHSIQAWVDDIDRIPMEVSEENNTRSEEITVLDKASQEFTLRLFAGWNLISLPLEPAISDPERLLTPLYGNYQAIFAFEADKTRYTSFVPESGGDLSTLKSGTGYWIYLEEAATLLVRGNPAKKTIKLSEGWNLAGCNSLQSVKIENALSSIGNKYLAVFAFDPVRNTYLSYYPEDPGNLSLIEPGKGYWIYTTEETNWTLP